MGEPDPQGIRAAGLVGRTLKSKWRLDALLGIGGMAAVFSARHRNGKRVAVKVLHAELAADERTRGRFLREGYVANKVDHPNVVNIIDDDTEEDGGIVFLVMELLEGETLRDRWYGNGRKLPLGDVLHLANEVLDVLSAAHERKIIHRDIKPANIFMTTDGKVKVLDFGIAKLKEGPGGTGQTTRMGATLGSPSFMSPEQARARWEFVDERTDLWAMGAVMFTMLSGEHVHEGKQGSEMMIATATSTARPLRQVNPAVPDVVAAIVDRALAFERTDRWQDARAMQIAVQRAMKIDFERAPQDSILDIATGDQVTAMMPNAAAEVLLRLMEVDKRNEDADRAKAADPHPIVKTRPIVAQPETGHEVFVDGAEPILAALAQPGQAAGDDGPKSAVTALLPTLQKQTAVAQAVAEAQAASAAAHAAPGGGGLSDSVMRARAVDPMQPSLVPRAPVVPNAHSEASRSGVPLPPSAPPPPMMDVHTGMPSPGDAPPLEAGTMTDSAIDHADESPPPPRRATMSRTIVLGFFIVLGMVAGGALFGTIVRSRGHTPVSPPPSAAAAPLPAESAAVATSATAPTDSATAPAASSAATPATTASTDASAAPSGTAKKPRKPRKPGTPGGTKKPPEKYQPDGI